MPKDRKYNNTFNAVCGHRCYWCYWGKAEDHYTYYLELLDASDKEDSDNSSRTILPPLNDPSIPFYTADITGTPWDKDLIEDPLVEQPPTILTLGPKAVDTT